VNRRQQRRWPWFQQSVDAVVTLLGVGVAVTMLIRDSWPPLGVMFALVCLGKVGSSAFIKALLSRWTP
jgi:hypothetical protein